MRKCKNIPELLSLMVLACLVCSCVAAPLQAEPMNYQDCLKGTHRIMRTFPPQCVTADGKVFIEGVTKGAVGRLCVDQCGNGTCEEIVCMSESCPCAETVETCPADCKK